MTDIIVNRRMDQRKWLALTLLSVLWGGSFLFAGLQVKALPPFTIVFLRVGLAAVILNILVRATAKTMPMESAAWRAFFAMGLLNNANLDQPYSFRIPPSEIVRRSATRY